ncbi:hypothetical protein ACSMTC_37490 [Kitasatospora sp. HPMI-4]
MKITAIAVAAGSLLGLTASSALSANRPSAAATSTASPSASPSAKATPTATATPSPTASPTSRPTPGLRTAVIPATAHPDQSVALFLRGCRNPGRGGTAEGALIGKGKERAPIGVTELVSGQRGTLVATAKLTNVKSGGNYEISFYCASDPKTVVKATLMVR